ncbi:non-ribosomal peptide synthetase [Paenibacillus sp. N1-5-1-14]|uniref:non-ribosomal peptide synthetase n=1 Tax=Paenibacillus radicibacter TaxID=2972488 RepID=UPI002159845A|nr:non-ribosomal peptide synthetase [Paenibacillus radicibacter]MCR8644640.1 non-ribosomal peptide synthetase [Paenibacillus radicibacter]
MNLLEYFTKIFNIYQDKRAIVTNDGVFTYRQLNSITSQIASHLISQGIGEEDVVTIETGDKLTAILMLLGVVRAGAAYCVIPEDYPEHRKEQMRAKVDVKWTLTDLSFITNEAKCEPLLISRNPDSLLYVIFTSGSTGIPKAVAIEDKAIHKIVNHPSFYAGEVIAQLAPLEFDASIYEVFGGLLNGMTLRLISKDDSLDFEVMSQLLDEVDCCFLTTRLFNLYVEELGEDLRKLSLILTGGERCSVKHLTQASQYCKVYNVYGPTETTVYATKYEVKGHEAEIPIGQLFDHGSYLIVDAEKQAVALGQQGELCISDSGLMRGYIGDDAATEKVFFEQDNKRYYSTGDIVYVNSDDHIVYVERKDRQVKIAGYRIELSEVENCAYSYGLQKECYAHYDGKRLYLYVKDQVDLESFRQHLRSRLPDYMIPTVKVVDIIPMNTNGKTDVHAISENPQLTPDHEIVDVVKNVLKSEIDLGMTFLDLGGDSIKAMEIIWQLGSKGYQLDLNMLFSRTLGEIVDNVANG